MSTKIEITTVVPINSFLFKPDFIKKALLKAPWLPVNPPKKPLKNPPRGRFFFSNFNFLKNGITSIKANINKSMDITNFNNFTSMIYSNSLYEYRIILLSNSKRICEPTKADNIAGNPNRTKTSLFTWLPTRNILKILFKKCTIPVNEIANSTGKYKIITGVNIVPRPKPEKKVKMAAKKVTSDIIRISIFLNNYFNGKVFDICIY